MSSVKDIPAVKDMLAKAEPILGMNILNLCLNGPEAELELTKNCQPAMFIAGLAGVEKLRADREEAVTRCQVLAGLSLGEYTALCVAGVFDFEEGLKLVKLRGEVMNEAANASKQAMLSVAGLEKPKLVDLCAQAAKKEGAGAVCQIANELFPKGFSVAGTEASITALDELLPKMKPPRFTVYMNATAAPMKPGTNPKEIIELMKKQLTSPVLWEPSVKAMIKEGVSEFYEVG